jgi:hypothetical protein
LTRKTSAELFTGGWEKLEYDVLMTSRRRRLAPEAAGGRRTPVLCVGREAATVGERRNLSR